MSLSANDIIKKLKKKKERFKRFKRNLRLAKRKTHFRVFASDLISSIKSDAKNISIFCLSFKRIKKARYMFFRNNKHFADVSENSGIKIRNPFNRIGYIYIKFYKSCPKNIIIKDKNGSLEIKCEYLHCLIDVSRYSFQGNLNVSFLSDVNINRIYVFTKGELPKWVQKWTPPCDNADLLAMSTHSDDEQLFFAGVLPLYSAKNRKIQVSYFAPPINVHRYNELLDGLWQIGIKNYPVFAPFYEEWSTSVIDAKDNLNNHDTTEEDIRDYIVSSIRRFKPKVIIGQDPVNGEYGHGQHMYFAQCLEKYINDSANPDIEERSIKEYGIYTVPKLYLHLYNKNKIVLDLDSPIKAFNGKTPFQLSQEGFSRHRSQYVSFFPRHIFGTIRHPITEAKQIVKYSPCEWGLVYSSVGFDRECRDMFENIEEQ